MGKENSERNSFLIPVNKYMEKEAINTLSIVLVPFGFFKSEKLYRQVSREFNDNISNT